MKTRKIFYALVAVCVLVVAGCKKDDDAGEYKPGARQFHVNLTGAPANFARLELTIDKVEAFHDSRGWIALSTDVSIVNVLSLTDGYKTSLATASSVQTGHYSRLRVHFLDANTVTVHSTVTIGNSVIEPGYPVPLTWAGIPERWVEIAIDHEVSGSAGVEVLLDFDVAASVYTGSNSYVINPVLREQR